MLNKLIIVFISLMLTSCFFEKAKEPVVIIDKSIGQEPIDSNHLSIAKIVEKRKITIKSALIPVAGRIIKTFSKSHQGLSFATNSGQAVRAIESGTVVYSGNETRNNTKMIIIKHALGFYSSYMQNQTLQVQSGNKVKKGQVIATTGKNNFYFEMKKFETPINPIKYLK
ncbi:murein hydrolase activator EnvC family protein [thiotrophic endosymbiont of Bathymodiolus puteoserpentis (Logatchev)]|uniref:murein hydrolase activator EnvC family protein n=1 Tax=thiotrophic endosymbiont of Bathymodiolus puteoserpentis (Logatchev) TaxID=343240 RepID=UPI0010BB1CAC|nr:M23 family metallopeptidase [thiotrophic endosymbiont of Bathymodiolus puteoserpentis (Logatchev)]CAC9582215.1 hypothetical protein [uncultured Gammaproteobacteria bacterium]CAC9985433.1 hypothetical protein [uncultured Gammaproteobacteria bacterium]SSC10596.1 hypothetical protein BPUTEOSOX_536 [thiotrophic endosymbiont of Bathymodiolus puteoserpentis (Logatchev)]